MEWGRFTSVKTVEESSQTGTLLYCIGNSITMNGLTSAVIVERDFSRRPVYRDI